MKNFIKYYYDIDIEEYKEINGNILFENYIFIEYKGNIDKLLRIYSLLINYNVYCHEIVLNRNNEVITIYDNKPYILLKKYIYLNDIITIEDILKYDINIQRNSAISWKTLWEEKLDYYEYQMSELGLKYKKLRDSFSYYSGLCECAISLLNYINGDVSMYITHIRIYTNETIDEFTNPINITIDNITRDIAGFIKNKIIHESITVEETISYISKFNLTNNEYILLMARLLYPSYYFDIYDNVIQETCKEEEIEKAIKKNNSFELFLQKIYFYIKERSNIPRIDWLHNSNYF